MFDIELLSNNWNCITQFYKENFLREGLMKFDSEFSKSCKSDWKSLTEGNNSETDSDINHDHDDQDTGDLNSDG